MNHKVTVHKIPYGFPEMHPSEAAVIAKYRVEAVVFRADGTEVTRGKKDATKLIHFINLADGTDLKRVARDAVSKCQYLDPNRIDELEQILSAIRNRQKQQSQKLRPSTAMRPLTATPVRKSKTEGKISELPQYRNLLYSSIEDKILGTEMILMLCEKKIYMQQILRSDPIINALSRLLFEDETRNLDLKINIGRIFSVLSQLAEVNQAPSLYLKNKIGGTLLQEVNIELQRYQKWKDEMTFRQAAAATGDSADQLETFRKKLTQQVRKQDLFILSVLEILLVLAKDPGTQMKMVKKDIILILTKCADRTNPTLQDVSLRFLLKLSLYVQSVEAFGQAGTAEKLVKLLDLPKGGKIVEYALRILYNISLCPPIRKTMVKKNFPRKLLTSLDNPQTTELTARLLYSISTAKKGRREVYSTEVCESVGRLIAQGSRTPHLLGFCANLLCSSLAAADFTRVVDLPALMDAALRTKDEHLLKVINSATKNHESASWITTENVSQIVEQVQLSEKTPFILECFVGLAWALENGSLTVDSLSRTYKIDVEVITKCRHFTSPPELLALVVFIGALGSQENSAKILVSVSMTDWLCQKLAEFGVDEEELILQTGYALFKLTQYEPARLRMMEYPGVTKILTDCMQQASDVTKALFEELLFRLSVASEEIHEAWKMERFQQYNGQWLQAIENRQEERGDNDLYLDDFNDDEMDLVTRFGLDDLSDEMEEDEDDVEDMIERYSARPSSQALFRK